LGRLRIPGLAGIANIFRPGTWGKQGLRNSASHIYSSEAHLAEMRLIMEGVLNRNVDLDPTRLVRCTDDILMKNFADTEFTAKDFEQRLRLLFESGMNEAYRRQIIARLEGEVARLPDPDAADGRAWAKRHALVRARGVLNGDQPVENLSRGWADAVKDKTAPSLTRMYQEWGAEVTYNKLRQMIADGVPDVNAFCRELARLHNDLPPKSNRGRDNLGRDDILTTDSPGRRSIKGLIEDAGGDAGLLARVNRLNDLEGQLLRRVQAADPETVQAEVEAWLRETKTLLGDEIVTPLRELGMIYDLNENLKKKIATAVDERVETIRRRAAADEGDDIKEAYRRLKNAEDAGDANLIESAKRQLARLVEADIETHSPTARKARATHLRHIAVRICGVTLRRSYRPAVNGTRSAEIKTALLSFFLRTAH